jgi:MFS family permease
MAAHTTLWRIPGFPALWVGSALTQLSGQMAMMVVPLISVTLLGASPAMMGLLAATETVPGLLLAVYIGAWVDRLPRRRVMAGTNLARAAALVAVIAIAARWGLSIPLLFAAAMVLGLTSVVSEVAARAVVPSVVGADHLVAANGLLGVAMPFALVAGPALGGFLVQSGSGNLAMLVVAAGFLGAAACWALLPAPVPSLASRRADAGMTAGLRLVWGDPVLRAQALATLLFTLAVSVTGTQWVRFASLELGLPSAFIGVVLAAAAPASFIAGALVAPTVRRIGIGRTMAAGVLVAGVGCLLVPLAAQWPMRVTLMAAMFMFTLGSPFYWSSQDALIASRVDDGTMGRTHAAMRMMVWIGQPGGALLGGWLMGLWGTWPVLVGSAVLAALLPLLVLARSPVMRASGQAVVAD